MCISRIYFTYYSKQFICIGPFQWACPGGSLGFKLGSELKRKTKSHRMESAVDQARGGTVWMETEGPTHHIAAGIQTVLTEEDKGFISSLLRLKR